MVDDHALARATLARLVRAAPEGRPDGRPLHAYRFSREDFDLARQVLCHLGRRALASLEGSALFVAFTAEWFRRDREGGHWDWKRPLREIGLIYGQDDPAATVGYGQIAAAVEGGLRWWRRPPLPGGDRVVAMVKEAGFPAAALRDNRRVTDWLRHAVRAIERGFDARDAVGSESSRMNASKIAWATFEAAVELCEAIVALRQLVRERAPAGGDPIAVLDAAQPDWRTRLPFELEPQDVATVVELVIRAPLEGSSALFATRHLRRSGATWRSTVSLGLGGPLERRRLPPRLADALGGAMRMRIVPRGNLIGVVGALAALERAGDDEDDPDWCARPLATAFEPPLALDAEVRLAAMVGDDLVDEFVAYAGESLAGEVVVLEPAGPGEPQACEELVVIGCSPARTKGPWLALAIAEASVARVSIEGERWDLGVCGERRVVGFSGVAVLDASDGTRLAWRTGAERSDTPRLVLVGRTVRRLRETVYRGLPGVWLEFGDLTRECRRSDLRWRPVGRGQWRALGEGSPWGRISIGLFEKGGDLKAFTNLVVTPEAFELVPSRARDGLRLEGAQGARVVARSGRFLDVTLEGDAAFVDLSGLDPGRTVELTLAWDAQAVVTLCNPIGSQALVDPTGAVAPRHHMLSIGRLHGYRMVTAEPAHLCFDLMVQRGPRRSFTRLVHGEAPLVAYLEDLRNLLGSSDNLDAAVRLSWIGGEGWTCEVRWYDLDPRAYEESDRGPFGASRLAILGVAQVRAISLAEPTRGIEILAGPGADLAGRLRAVLGGPPWLVFGAARHEAILRPRIVDDGRREAAGAASPFEAAVRHRVVGERARRLSDLAADPAGWTPEDRRRWLDLLGLAASAGLPYAALDPLRVLDRHPAAAVWLLAFAEDAEEQRAVLGLQRELPFLWACTSVPLWLDAFEARAAQLDEHLRGLGVDPALGASVLLTSIGQIADRAPDLASRLRTILLVLFAGGRRACPAGSYEALAERLQRMAGGVHGPDLGGMTNLFMQRHADGPEPPRGLGLAARTPAARELVQRYVGFDDVVAAPVAAAMAAFSAAGPDAATLEACRAAWLFDPEHFDATTALLVAAWTVKGGPPKALETAG